MKKIYALLIITLFFCQVSLAEGLEILPTMQTMPHEHDKVWAGSFQLAWNTLAGKITRSAIRFPDGTPQIAKDLNQLAFTSENISKKDYYKNAGIIKSNSQQKIAKYILKKFNVNSELLNSMTLTPDKNRYFVYGILKKDFQFADTFDNLGVSKFGYDQNAEYFGIDKNSNNDLRVNVKVLFYNSPNDFAVKLNGTHDEEIIVYKSVSSKSFSTVYGDILRKTQNYKGSKKFTDVDTLKVPIVKVDEEINYTELSDKRIKGTLKYLDSAISTIKFSMDGTGVARKKRVPFESNYNQDIELTPRDFAFDGKCFIFVQQKYKNRPYFAVCVNDITKFQ